MREDKGEDKGDGGAVEKDVSLKTKWISG